MNRRSSVTAWLFVAPALAFYLAFFALPIVQSFAVSLFEWRTDSATPERFVGLDNYARLVRGGDLVAREDRAIFWTALFHNFALLALSLVIQLPLAMFLAVLLSGRVVARTFFRTAFFLPMILPSVVIALVWRQMYMPVDSQGLILQALDALGLPYPPNGFLADGRFSLLAVIASISWRFTGFHMVLFLAGIQSIPEELYEAARVDGAGAWAQFRYVTLPSLRGVIQVSALLSIVGSLKYFDLVWVMTEGGPGRATELVTTYMYKVAFHENAAGFGSALAVAGFVVSLIVVGAARLFFRREESPAGEAA